MKKPLTLLTIALIINACAPVVNSTPNPSITPVIVTTSTNTISPTSASALNSDVQKVFITDKYVIEIPKDFTVRENLSSSTTTVPIYRIETSTGAGFDIVLHPYIVSSSPTPGKCIVSTDLDAGITSGFFSCR